ncbi:MAG: RNA-binding domain-containing protein [Acidimicrobiia bacterium]
METPLFIFVILAAGLAAGSVARFLVPGEQRLSLAETTIIGMVGSAVGGGIINLVTGDNDLGRFDLGSVIGAIAGSVLVLAIGTWVADRFGLRTKPELPIAQTIGQGESATVEFKSTARWNVHTQSRDDKMELVIAKTIAGFLNAEGGLLIIGVDDDGHAVGLDMDLAQMKAPDHDRYELWLIDLLERTIGKPAVAFVTVGFEPFEEDYVVTVRVEPSDTPVFVDEPKGGRTADFYVRMGNSTRKLLTDEFAEYERSRWK